MAHLLKDRSSFYRSATFVLVCLLGVSASTSFAHGQQQENQQAAARSDADIQKDVEAALIASPVLNGQEIHAQTFGGGVTLTGYVDDEASKDLAKIVTSKVNGVRSVVNQLTVVPIGAPTDAESGANAQAPTDQQGPDQKGQDAEPTTADSGPAVWCVATSAGRLYSSTPRISHGDEAPALRSGPGGSSAVPSGTVSAGAISSRAVSTGAVSATGSQRASADSSRHHSSCQVDATAGFEVKRNRNYV